MAKKIIELTTTNTAQNDDLLVVETNINTLPETKAISVSDISKSILKYTTHKNYFANPNFSIAQRNPAGGYVDIGATFAYAADRWKVYKGGYSAGAFFTRAITTNAGQGRNVLYVGRSSGTDTSPVFFSQELETEDSYAFRGKYATVALRMQKGAGLNGTLNVYLITGTGTNQSIHTGFTGAANVYLGTINISQMPTTTWADYVFTTPTPLSESFTQIGLSIIYTPAVGTVAANEHFAITLAQLSIGKDFFGYDIPTEAENLARCLRFYERIYSTGGETYFYVGSGSAVSATTADIVIRIAPKRANPTFGYGGTFQLSYSSVYAVSNIVLGVSGLSVVRISATSSGMTPNTPVMLRAAGDANAFVEFRADL